MKTGIRSGLAYKNGYKQYKLENRVEKNKLKKLEKHCKKYPHDTMAKDALAKVKKSGYIPRTKPTVPGSNPPEFVLGFEIVGKAEAVRTAGEQIAALLGVKLPTPKVHRKPRIIKKPTRRNAKKVS